MKKLVVKTADCSHDTLERIARKCSFVLVAGKRHTKVKNREGIFITTIPRKNRLKRETARGVVKAFIEFGCDITYS